MSAEPNRPRRALIWSFVALGAIALIVVILVAVQPGLGGGARQPGAVASETPDARFRVTQAQLLAGTNLVQIEIGTGGSNSGGSSFGSLSGGTEQRNLLLLDRTSGEARRLLPDNQRIITQTYFLPAQANETGVSSETAVELPAADAPPPAYFALLVAQTDHPDRFDLLVGSLAGPAQRFVMQGLDGVDAIWMQSPTQIGLLVRERLNLFYRIVDVPTLRMVQSRRVAT